jgi:trigger factor
MQVTVESGEGLERRLNVELPAGRLTEEVDKRLKQLARNVRMDGFRPGKVPMRLIKQRFGGQVTQEAAAELVQATLLEATAQEKLRLVGEPRIELRGGDTKEAFGYTATFEVMPEIEDTEVVNLKVKRPVAEVTEADVDAMIEKLRKQRVKWNQVERPAQEGDTLKIDFEGFIDGAPFEGGKAEGIPLRLGSGSMVEGFEAGLIGAISNESRTLNLRFPDDYRASQLAGKDASFEVKVNEVSEPHLPEVDAEFIKAFGVEDGTLESLRADVRGNMERELRHKLRSATKDQVLDALVSANPLTLPKVLVQEEAMRLKEQTKAEMAQSGQGNAIDFPIEMFNERAERRIAIGMLMAHIVQKHDLQVDELRVRELIEEVAAAYENPNEVVDFYMNDKEQRANVENLALEEQVVDWLLGQAEVEEEGKSFEEVMG